MLCKWLCDEGVPRGGMQSPAWAMCGRRCAGSTASSENQIGIEIPVRYLSVDPRDPIRPSHLSLPLIPTWELPIDIVGGFKVYKVYKDKAFSQELRLLACS